MTGPTSTHKATSTDSSSASSRSLFGSTNTQRAFGTRVWQTRKTFGSTSVDVTRHPMSANTFDHRPPSQPTSSKAPGFADLDKTYCKSALSTPSAYWPYRVPLIKRSQASSQEEKLCSTLETDTSSVPAALNATRPPPSSGQDSWGKPSAFLGRTSTICGSPKALTMG